MAERENPFTVMKHYLTTMSKRIEEIGSKTSSLEAETKRQAEQNVSEQSRLSDKLETQKSEISGKLEELTSKTENNQSQLLQAIEQLKANLEDIKSSSASREDLQTMQNSLREDISSIREQKLEKAEFHNFVEKNNASMKEVFSELAPADSFADFATEQVSSRPTPMPVIEEAAPAAEPAAVESEPVEKDQPPAERFIPEQRREDKRKKKWL